MVYSQGLCSLAVRSGALEDMRLFISLSANGLAAMDAGKATGDHSTAGFDDGVKAGDDLAGGPFLPGLEGVAVINNATAAKVCDIIVLALPQSACVKFVQAHRQALAGKVLVDVSNPSGAYTRAELDRLHVGSFAALLQQEAGPDCSVVKVSAQGSDHLLLKGASIPRAADRTSAELAMSVAISAFYLRC